jgi:ferritin-like metal-binding protein YciE
MAHQPNLGTGERWLSLLGGVGMLLTTARGGNIGRVARGALGLSMLARGATGYCHVKAALTSRASDALANLSGSKRLDSLEGMYEAELQELYSAEAQLARVANDLARTMTHPELAFRLQEYATELHARRRDLENFQARIGAETGGEMGHETDDAMRALIAETEKMWRISAPNVRDAAVTASVQRIIHYKIAGYGAIASYAKALGRTSEAAHFAQLADRDKAVDGELSDLAKATLNPDAAVAPEGEGKGESRNGDIPHFDPRTSH